MLLLAVSNLLNPYACLRQSSLAVRLTMDERRWKVFSASLDIVVPEGHAWSSIMISATCYDYSHLGSDWEHTRFSIDVLCHIQIVSNP